MLIAAPTVTSLVGGCVMACGEAAPSLAKQGSSPLEVIAMQRDIVDEILQPVAVSILHSPGADSFNQDKVLSDTTSKVLEWRD